MRGLLRSLVLLVLIAYLVGRYGSEFLRLLGTATGVVSRVEERAPLQDNADNLDTFNGCGMQGDARSLAVQALDRLKNRYTAPNQAEIDPRITLAAILAPLTETDERYIYTAVEDKQCIS